MSRESGENEVEGRGQRAVAPRTRLSEDETFVITRLKAYQQAWGDNEAEKAEQRRVAMLDKDARLEIYSQKAQTFRHFDSLRWQVPGLVFAVGGALFGFGGEKDSGLPHFLALAMYGVFALAGSFAMRRIRFNLRMNNLELRRFAMSLGDYGILPPPRMKSASTVMHALLAIVGFGALILSAWIAAGG